MLPSLPEALVESGRQLAPIQKGSFHKLGIASRQLLVELYIQFRTDLFLKFT